MLGGDALRGDTPGRQWQRGPRRGPGGLTMISKSDVTDRWPPSRSAREKDVIDHADRAES
jgi:hypothetical protein